MHPAYQLLYFVGAFIIIGVAGLLFLQRPKNTIVRVFFALGLSVAGWVLTLYYYYSITDPATLLQVGRVNYGFAELLIYLAFIMAYLFPEKDREWPNWLHGVIAGATIAVIGLTLGTNLVVETETIVGISRSTYYGPFFWVFVTYFLSLAAGSVWLLISKLRHLTGRSRKQLAVYTVGWGIGIIVGSATNLLVPLLTGYFDIQHLGPVAATIFALGVAYAVVKHQMLDIRVVGAELLFYTLMLFFVINLSLAITPLSQAIGIIMLLAGLIAGLAMVRSVRQEVKRREELDELADTLSEANRKLRELDELKSEFISIASHQLRTPVSVIKGYLSLIKDGAFGEIKGELKEKMEQIYDMNERLVHLINNLLNISRIEKGTSQFWCSQVSIQGIIRRIVAEMAFKTKGKDLNLVFVEPEEEIPPVFVDPERVTEVLVNLIDNAIKYTHVGMVRVTLSAQGEGDPVIVRVTDTGIGIDVEDRQHIFQKFYRPHRPTEEHKAGLSLGLGLYICSKFLRSMGGDIWIEHTAPGKGTTFAFSLPTEPGGVCAEMVEQEGETEGNPGSSPERSGKKNKKEGDSSDDSSARSDRGSGKKNKKEAGSGSVKDESDQNEPDQPS